jgi:cytochrome c biogenesis protein ResB
MYFIRRLSNNSKFQYFKKKDKKSLTAADKLQTPTVFSTSFYFWLVLAACGWSLTGFIQLRTPGG